MKRTLFFLSICSLWASLGVAATYYVSPTGDDAANGLTEGTAWLSLDNGDNKGMMHPGDTVLIHPGLYTISDGYVLLQSGTAAEPIVYRKTGKGKVRIDANDDASVILLIEGDNNKVCGLHLLNAKDDAVHIKGDSNEISTCYIASPGRRGIRTEGNYNLFYRNVIAFAGEDGIKNEDAGKWDNRYYHNTIYQSAKHGIEIKSSVVGCRVFNCIIVESGDHGISSPSVSICAFNNVWGSLNGDYDGVADSAGGISSQPRFVDPEAERFDLKTTAEEIDAGYDLGYPYNRTAPDMGAFEKYNTYYVSTTGNDINSGTSPSAAWNTIDNGDSLLYPGDTVYILPGEYVDSVIVTDSGLVNDAIVYSGVRDSTVLQGSWLNGLRVQGSYLIIEGVHVVGAAVSGFYVSGSYNMLNECRSDSSGQYGIDFVLGSNNSVVRSVISTSGVAGILSEGNDLTVYHNTFFENGDFDVDVPAAAGLQVINCIFMAGMPPLVTPPLAAIQAPASAIIRHCMFFKHPTQVVGGATVGTGCFVSNPKFLDPESGDFRLQSTSAAIDAGEYLGMAYEGAAPDLGAYETGVPVELTIVPYLDSLFADSQYQFSVEAYDDLGYPADPGILSWSHTFGSGSISSTGLFTPQLVGSGSICVLAVTNGLTDTTALMNVVPGSLYEIVVDPERDTVSADSTRLFAASGVDIKGNAVADMGTLSWSVLNGIGTIDDSGLFTARRAGNGFIRAASDYGIIGVSDTILVVPGEIAFIDVQPEINIIVQGDSYLYSAYGYDADSNLVGDLTTSAAWSTTDATGSVEPSGMYTAGVQVSPPVYWVRADWGGFSDSGQVSVISNGLLAYIRIEYADGTPVNDTTLNTDNDTTRVYSRGYSSGDSLMGDLACAWSVVGTDSIGTVVTPNGTSTRLQLTRIGTGQIAAQYAEDMVDTSGIITCVAGSAARVEIQPDSAMSVTAGDTVAFTAEFFDADDNVVDETPIHTWGVIGGIGDVASSGLFTPTQAGGGYVFVSAGSLADTSALITVLPGALMRIEVSPDTALVSADSSLLFTVFGFDAYDNAQNPGAISWSLTQAVGTIDGAGLFDAVTVGSARVIGVSDLGPVDTSAYLEVYPGTLKSLIVSPDSLEITTDSAVSFTAAGYDSDGNPVTPTNLIWSTLYDLGDIVGSGWFEPHTVGVDRILATYIAGPDTVLDTNTAVVILPGMLDRINISPNTTVLGIGDTLQFSAVGYDADFNVTDLGSLDWAVVGGIGTIDTTGLFTATASGNGQITATSAATGVTASTGLITVEALYIAGVVLGNKTVRPGDTSAVLLKCRLINEFARAMSVDSLAVRSAFGGAGIPAELNSNVTSVHLYVDADDNSSVSSGDDLIATTSMESSIVGFTFDSIVVSPASELPIIVAVDVALYARDSDSLDFFIRPHEDIRTTDNTAIESDDSVNSAGVAIIDGMVADQVSLVSRPFDSVAVGDSLIYLAKIDFPRNGYTTDTLNYIIIINNGTASESDIDSILFFADNGDGIWGGAQSEERVAKLVFTGSHWTRSGLSQPLPDQTNRFFVAARFAQFAANGASVLLSIPENGIGVASGNDGPIDGNVTASDSIIILLDHKFEITGVSLPSRSLIPGTNTGPILGLRLSNGLQNPIAVHGLTLGSIGADPHGAAQADLDSQIDSVGLYLAGDVDYTTIGPADVLLGTALLTDGAVSWTDPGISVAGAGAEAVVLMTAWLNEETAKNGNTIGFSLDHAADIVVDSGITVFGSFPLANTNPFVVDAFPAQSVVCQPVGITSLFGGSYDQLVLDFRIPANGYSPDTIDVIELTNLRILDPDVITAVHLYADVSPSGYGAEDSLLTLMVPSSDTWRASKLQYPVPVGGARFFVLVDISEKSFEGGTLALAIPRGGLTYRSGMIGPDDTHAAPGEEILVFPPNRVTAVSIPLGTSSIYPGSSENPLLTFALYNGYIGQTRHLNRVTLTNSTKSRSDAAWADREVGQIRLYYDDNRNRTLDGDSLAGTGMFADGRLILSGMSIELPPESLSYFFVTSACPLDAIDADSLAAVISGASEFGFAEPVSLNGDLPLTRSGYLIINGSIARQYTIFPIPSRSLSPGDSNIVLFACRPAVNGNQVDTLMDFTLSNSLDAGPEDLHSLQLWSDINGDQQWQPGDVLVGALNYSTGAWRGTGLNYQVDSTSAPLLVIGSVSDTAGSGRDFRGYFALSSCNYTSGNDGPIDVSLSGNATFTISSSALRVQYTPMRKTYSVGEPITLIMNATNRLGITLDSVYSQVSRVGDTTAVISDSAFDGPISLAADSSGIFIHYFTAAQPGAVVFQSRAVAVATGDSSATIETEQIRIQAVPSGMEISLHNFMPTAVTRGQKNVFPLSLELRHGDSADAAPIRVSSVILSTLTGSGVPQPANTVLSRLQLAGDQTTFSIRTVFPDSAEVELTLNPELTLQPGDTVELVLLMDIADSSTATNLILGIEDATSVDPADANTGSAVSLIPDGTFPLRTASCRIDDPTTALAISNVSRSFAGVNAGQDNVPLLCIGLRHPGTVGMSQVQVVGLSLIAVSGTDTLYGSSVADRIAVYRSTELLGEATGALLQTQYISLDLGSGLTINPNARDSLYVSVSVAPEIARDSFQITLPDSSVFVIRDAVSGSEVTAVTDHDYLATGSVFPLASSVVRVYQASENVSYCLTDRLPSSVVAGTDSVSLLDLNLTYTQSPDHAPVRITDVAVRLLDSTGTPLDPGRLFDRTGWRIGTGPAEYHATLTLVGGATVFPLSDTGIILLPSTGIDIGLIADIERDIPYDNFRLIIDDVDAIGLCDAIDTNHVPSLTATVPCDAPLPYQSGIASIFMPAGAPRLMPGDAAVRIAGAGQQGFTVGEGSFDYTGGVQQGDIEFTSFNVVIVRRNDGPETPVTASSIFSAVSLLNGQDPIAVDSILNTDTLNFLIDPSMILMHGRVDGFRLSADIRGDADPGTYRIKVLDSTAVILSDRNLGLSVYPILSVGGYPAVLGTFSISSMNLKNSFSNYPNPFVPAAGPTTIAYVLPEDARVDIEIFTITGDPVAHIASGDFRAAGPHQNQTWDGLNDAGLKVVPGTYFCRLTARYVSGRTETARRKVSVVR